MMNNLEKQYNEDPDASSKLSMAILVAYGILITAFLVLVGVIYLFSHMVDKLS